ncbi:hypothetical protein [Pseudoroseicyclus aestuarii]|uniref:Uncharacterized protein n=1 Tax=Pseudoroseicyclus aestuarii TaxID=1795041 RepID=A0A318SQL5_9RHOB|nr:hypothetical protein [Pseudoroseicyclus aestuarii]PYE83983.1 hypothetical protein DFP88_103345 [Pseudoroseicyclus aestuarii]
MTNRILTAALVALTATAGLATTASAYTAEGALGARYEQPTNFSVEFPVVNAAEAGTVTVLRADGTVIGATDVHAGINTDVRVSWPAQQDGRLRAVLTDASGTEVSQRWVNLYR